MILGKHSRYGIILGGKLKERKILRAIQGIQGRLRIVDVGEFIDVSPGFQDKILKGEYDSVDENEFYMKGDIADVKK